MTSPDGDFESQQDQLDEDVGDPVDFWERKQRELVTSVVDYNLQGLADLVSERAIDLNPAYQRRLRWDEGRQSRLIESFLMNVPVPPVFLNEDEYGAYSVIDGKQRITSISDFMRGKLRLRTLTVFHELNGKTIDELPLLLQRAIRTRPTLRAVIILRQSDAEVKYNVFQRLNTGGVKLNAQEIRNSAFPGPLNAMINQVAEDARFHSLLGIHVRAKSALYQEMRDAEFVLRYLTFRRTWTAFAGGMRRQMDAFMDHNKNANDNTIAEYRTAFQGAVEAVAAAFGEHAYHRWVPEKAKWRKQVLAALFDAQMFAVEGLDPAALAARHDRVIRGVQDLFSDALFRQSIDAATNAPGFFQRRIRATREMLMTAVAG